MLELLVAVAVVAALFVIKIGGVWAAVRRYGPRLFPGQRSAPVRFAVVRTILGVVGTGAALGLGTLGSALLSSGDFGDSGFIGIGAGVVLQLLFRALAWFIAISIFYDRRVAPRSNVAAAIGGGVAWSYVLDVPSYVLALAGVSYVFRDFRIC